MAGIVFLMSATFSIQLALEGKLHGTLLGIAWGSAASCLAYLLFIRPKVTFFDEGVAITNPFVEVTVGWQMVEEIESRYCMSILVGEKHIYAWAAPAPGRYHARNIHGSELKGMKIGSDQMIQPGQSPRTHSGVASHLAQLRLDRFRSAANSLGCESGVKYNLTGAIVLTGSLAAILFLNFIHF